MDLVRLWYLHVALSLYSWADGLTAQERRDREKEELARLYGIQVPARSRPAAVERAPPCQRPDQQRPLVAYAGMQVALECQVCKGNPLPPDSGVKWEFQPNGTKGAEPMDTLRGLRAGYRFQEGKRRVLFAAVRRANAGKYFCKPGGGGELLGAYDLTVFEEPFFHLVFESHRDQPYGEETANDGTTLFTKWGTWTGCNHCGELGEKFQFGYCYARYRPAEFPGGVPCRSNLLAYGERLLFGDRRDEKIVRICEEPCPEGKQGNSMSDSKAMETYYVDFDLGRPKIPTEVEKQLLYIDQGGSVQLLCPGGGLEGAIRWHNGTQPLVQTRMRGERVQIDAMHALRIRNVLPGDGRVYTCYHDRKLVASITIEVVAPVSVNKTVKNNLMYVGIALTGMMGLIIWASVFKNRKRHSFGG